MGHLPSHCGFELRVWAAQVSRSSVEFGVPAKITFAHEPRRICSVPMQPTSLLGTEDADIADAVLNASKVLVGIAARSLAGAADDITLPQYRALVLIASRGTQRPVDLAEALAISSSGITRLCDRLVNKDLITRETGRGADRREARLDITPDGKRLVDKVMEKRLTEIMSILERLSRPEQERIASALTNLAVAAGETPEGSPSSGWAL